MVGVAALPHDIAVMMFRRENHHFHSGVLYRLAPLVRIESFQSEGFRGLESAAPLLSGEGVRSEMDERDEFPVKCCQLVSRRHDIGGLFNDGIPVITVLQYFLVPHPATAANAAKIVIVFLICMCRQFG